MKINLRIIFADGKTSEIVVNAADMVAFENKFDKSIAVLQSDYRLTYMAYLAWHSESRQKKTDLDFDTWLGTIENVTGSEEDPK